ADRVDHERLLRRPFEHLTGANVERRAVAVADDPGSLEVAVGERALLVRAVVVEGGPGAVVETSDGDLTAGHGDGVERRTRRLGPHAHPLRHAHPGVAARAR